jgi:hypothetical protein
MAFFSLAALSLPGQGPSSLLPDGPEYKDVDGWSVKPTPREQLPEFLAEMMDEANPPLDPAEVTELLAMKHKKDKDDKEKKGKLVNSGGQLAWIEKKKLGVCACAKCGTTALFNGIYKGVFHKDKDWKGDIQQLRSPHWKHLWASHGGPADFFVSGIDGNESGTHNGHAMAFVREPVSRLISAWKDKFSCGLWVPQEMKVNKKGEPVKGDGGWFEASDGHTRRSSNIKLLTKLVGSGGSGDTKVSHNCPKDPNSPNSNTTFDMTCKYSSCLSLEKFADYLMIVHKKGLQDEMNAHVKPQTRACFSDGATPDKYDKVTTGYDKGAIKKLGQLMGAHISLDDDGQATKQGAAHSTADALMDGKPLKIPSSVIHKLKQITREEEQMLHKYYSHTEAMLMGRAFSSYVGSHKDTAGDAGEIDGLAGSWRPENGPIGSK